MEFEKLLEEGTKLIEQKEYDEALKIAKKIQREDNESADGYHLEAIAKQHLQEWEDSIDALDRAIDKSPYDAGLYNLRGFAEMSLTRYAKAEKDFEEAIDLEDFEPAHRNMVLLKILQEKGNEAINYLLERIKANPKNVENWILMGDLMMRGGQEEKAKTYYAQAQKMDPENEYLKNQLS
jgi:tetratricopeptide (TPR) repeat protein